MHAKDPEREPAERALCNGDQHVALHRRPDDGREALEQARLDRRIERDRGADLARQRGAVAQQEEQQVHGDAEADDKVERVLAEVDRAAGEHLPALQHRRRQLRLNGGEIVESEPLEQPGRPRRQRR